MKHDTGASSEPNTQSYLLPQNSKYKWRRTMWYVIFYFRVCCLAFLHVIFP